MTRLDARKKIVQAANRRRLYSGAAGMLGLYNMRQIQQAVHVCRHWGLVPAETLEAAGYRTENPR